MENLNCNELKCFYRCTNKCENCRHNKDLSKDKSLLCQSQFESRIEYKKVSIPNRLGMLA